MLLCVCKCYQEIEDGETRRRAIPPSVFILSLNSRPATEANGVLIYSWMTHTCHPLHFSDRQVTPPCHMCIYTYSHSYLNVLFIHFTGCNDPSVEKLYVFLVCFFLISYLHSIHLADAFSRVTYIFHPHRKQFGVCVFLEAITNIWAGRAKD